MSQAAGASARRRIDLSRHVFIVALGDCAIAVAAYVAAFLLRAWLPLPWTSDLMPSQRLYEIKHYWWLLTGLQPALLFLFDLYHDIRFKRKRQFAAAAAGACGIQVLILVAAYFFTGNLVFPRSIFPIYWLLSAAGVTAWRVVVRSTASRGRRRRALIVGGGLLAEQLVLEIRRAREIGLEVIGVASDHLPRGTQLGSFMVLGTRRDIEGLIRLHGIEEVILTPEEASWKDRLVDAVSRLEGYNVHISIVPSVYELLIGRFRQFNVRDIPLIEVGVDPNDPVIAFFRRLRDLLFAMLFVLLLLPLWIVVAIAIKLSDQGSVVYRQERIGLGGRPFRVFKFRTMVEDAENGTGPVLAVADDPRLTSLGRFLRSYRIDESLQLINVLRGEMSMVGPRPDRPAFVEKFSNEIIGYSQRHKIKPGITGLAQVRGHYHTDPTIKLKYDLAYIHNYSFLLDLLIMIETVRIVLRRQGV